MSVLEEIEAFKKLHENKQKEDVLNNQPQEEETLALTPSDTEKQPLATTEQAYGNAVQAVVNKSTDIKEMTRDLTYLSGANNLQGNKEFTDEYEEVLGKQLLEDLKNEGKRQAIKDEAKRLEAKNLRAQAFYNGCKPIFKMLDIDEAFGLIPMMITVVLLMIPFLIVSFIRFVVNSVNSIFTSIAGFKKPAFWLCSIMIVFVITIMVVIAGMWGVDLAFGTHIILK